VVRRLAEGSVPPSVRVADFGIRGVHLAYELLDGAYETTILVDATPRGGAPGTVYLIEPDLDAIGAAGATAADAHDTNPDTALALVRTLGGTLRKVLVVGSEPAGAREEQMGLSEPVAAAVDDAVALIQRLVGQRAETAL